MLTFLGRQGTRARFKKGRLNFVTTPGSEASFQCSSTHECIANQNSGHLSHNNTQWLSEKPGRWVLFLMQTGPLEPRLTDNTVHGESAATQLTSYPPLRPRVSQSPFQSPADKHAETGWGEGGRARGDCEQRHLSVENRDSFPSSAPARPVSRPHNIIHACAAASSSAMRGMPAQHASALLTLFTGRGWLLFIDCSIMILPFYSPK